MNTPKFKQFAAAFQKGGAAALILNVIRYRSGVIKATVENDKLFLEEIPRQIQEETLNVRNDIDVVKAVNEIEEKLMSLDKSEREGYIHKVILYFKDWADVFNPISSIERLTAKVQKLEQNKLEPTDSRKEFLKNEELNAVKGFLQKRKDIMAAAKSLLKENHDVVFWQGSLIGFAHCLAAMLLRHQIDLMKLQKECGIYLVKDIDLHFVAHYIGSEEYVRKLMNELPSDDKEPQQEDKKDNKTSHFGLTILEDELTRIYEELKSNGFISGSTTLEQWRYVCKGAGEPVDKPIEWTESNIGLGYFVTRLFKDYNKNFWELTKDLFTVKGQAINIASLKSQLSRIMSGYNSRPKMFDVIDKIIQ